MTEAPQPTEKTAPTMAHWQEIAHRRGPSLFHWLLFSLITAGILLYLSPITVSSSLLVSALAILVSPILFLLGWDAGMSTFAISCDAYRRLHRTWPLLYLLPIILVLALGLGWLGGRYWWIFSFVLAFLGHRKGTQRAWWSAVTGLAFALRHETFLRVSGAMSDEEALSHAIDSVNEEIGKRPRRMGT
jgi:hypothetical protein